MAVMPLSDAERQKRYRRRMGAEGVKRYQVMVPNSVADQVRAMTDALGCTKSELFTRLIEEEFVRLGIDGGANNTYTDTE